MTAVAEVEGRLDPGVAGLAEDFSQQLYTALEILRLEKGMELLRSTDLPVTEIAALCGYSGSSYFAERFRQIKGCTPMQYRRM